MRAFRRALFAVALAAALATVVASCGDDDDDNDSAPLDEAIRATITVDPSAAVAEVDDRFVSFAVDASQFVGGHWWSASGEVEVGVGQMRVPPYDFTRPRLRKLTAELAPAFLRIGGSEADKLYYDIDGSELGVTPEGFEFTVTPAMWDGMADFARDLGLSIFFTVNAGPGVRGEGRVWTPDNARDLIEYATSRGDPVGLWELGNEINGFALIHGFKWIFTADEYARDLAALKALVIEVNPGTPVGGPASAFWPVIGEWLAITPAFIRNHPGVADVITWHYYPTQSRRCPVAVRPATPTILLDPSNLNEFARLGGDVIDQRDRYAPGTPLWLGETGNAQCGGEPGVSDRFVASLWWIDELGAAARMGQPVVIRQTLSGSDYGMIDEDTLEPRPDYWASVLWKRLMGRAVLDATREGDNHVRAYAHCAPEGGVTVVAENLSRDREAVVAFSGVSGPVEVYAVDADALDAKTARLNGVEMVAGEDGSLPELAGHDEGDLADLRLPPFSYAFVRFPEAGAAACP